MTSITRSFTWNLQGKVKGSGNKKSRYAVNMGGVWGEMATSGGGHSNLNEAAAALDLPRMSKNTFISIETQIRNAWEAQLVQEMSKAGEEERQILLLIKMITLRGFLQLL